jgi:ketosteroid isomerase-like protein
MKLTTRIAVLLLGVVIGLLVYHRTPDEKLIRQSIDAAVQAVEQADASALIAQLTDDFDGNKGAMTRQDVANPLRLARLRGETLHAVVGPVDVQKRGERYVADFTVTLTSGGKVLPAQLGVYKVEAAWRKDGREWRCYEATWTQQL